MAAYFYGQMKGVIAMAIAETSNKFSGGGVLNSWVKAASDAGLQDVTTEIDKLKKSVSDGKTAVAGAITDKGITTATDAAFATMADNIGQISTLATETADATATAAQILSGKRAYAKGSPVLGTMPNNGGVSAAISSGSLKAGYTTGGSIANLVAGNIKQSVNIGGVVGNLKTNDSKSIHTFTIQAGIRIPYKASKYRILTMPVPSRQNILAIWHSEGAYFPLLDLRCSGQYESSLDTTSGVSSGTIVHIGYIRLLYRDGGTAHVKLYCSVNNSYDTVYFYADGISEEAPIYEDMSVSAIY